MVDARLEHSFSDAVMSKTLCARSVENSHGTLQFRSPAIGMCRCRTRVGQSFLPGDIVAEIEVLNRKNLVIVPPQMAGTVTQILVKASQTVQFDDELFSIVLNAKDFVPAGTDLLNLANRTVNSPLSGTFYRSASPQEPPLAQEGDVIQPGAALGLVEAMKVFNTLTFDGAEPLKLAKVLVENGASVECGQQIFVFV